MPTLVFAIFLLFLIILSSFAAIAYLFPENSSPD